MHPSRLTGSAGNIVVYIITVNTVGILPYRSGQYYKTVQDALAPLGAYQVETAISLTGAVDDRRHGGIVPLGGKLRRNRYIFAPDEVAGAGIRAGRKNKCVTLPCGIDGILNLIVSIITGNMNGTREYFLKVHIHMCNIIRADVFGGQRDLVAGAERWISIRADPPGNSVSRVRIRNQCHNSTR